MNKDKLRQIMVGLSVIATIVVNGLANALPLNGVTSGEVSNRFGVYFVPAGYVFSVWGLIYAGLVADGFGASSEAWAVIMLIAGAVITSAVTLTRGDMAHALAILWAFVGISVKHTDVQAVMLTAWIVAYIVAIALVAGQYVQQRHRTQ